MLPFKLPLGALVEAAVEWSLDRFYTTFRAISDGLFAGIDALQNILLGAPPWVLIVVLAGLARLAAGWGVAAFVAVGLLVIDGIGLWQPTWETFSLVVAAEILVLAIGLPLGIWASRNDWVDRLLRPVLDFMQTMPSFVYLIPAVMLFGLGTVPGVLATVVFALPPLVRLTNLGIRQVPVDLVEAGEAFGSSPLQMLAKVQLPVALPTIMAGVNQSIMLALSMVVIAAMIGAGGLGAEVLRGIQRLQIGTGFEAGLAVVLLAMTLDRLTQSVGKSRRTTEGG